MSVKQAVLQDRVRIQSAKRKALILVSRFSFAFALRARVSRLALYSAKLLDLPVLAMYEGKLSTPLGV